MTTASAAIGESPSVKKTTRPARIAMFDALRFIAAIAIVWQHTPESPQLKPLTGLSGFAVPFFVAGAMYLLVDGLRRDPARGYGSYIVTRFKRIYIPFLIWTAIYLLIRNVKHILLTHQSKVEFSWGFLLAGSAHHLWFLPYLLILCIVVFPLAKLVVGRGSIATAMGVVLIVAGIALGLTPQDSLGWSYVLNRAWNMMPAALWGIALGFLYPLIPSRTWEGRLIGSLGLAIAIAGAALSLTQWRTIFSDNAAGIGVLLVALSRWSSPTINRLASMGGLAYGIYLSHVMFVEGAQAVAAKRGLAGLGWLDILVFLFAAGASIVLTALLARRRWGRLFIPA